MAAHTTADIRNIAFVGHGGSGKTILAEACLVAGKRIKRIGSIADGTTVGDSDELEREQQRTVDAAMTHLRWKDKRIQMIDTPGYPDSIGEAICGLSAVDAAVVCVDATAGVKVNTRQMWKVATEMGLPRAICVTRADLDHARWDDLLTEIRTSLGESAMPYTVPAGGAVGPALEAVAVASADGVEGAKDAHAALIERAVESDEDLMMMFLEGETLSADDEARAVATAFRDGALFPVFVTAAEKGIGVQELLDAVVGFFPSPPDRTFTATDDDSGESVEVKADDPFTARCFKMHYDPFVGKQAFLRVVSGSIEAGATVRIKTERNPIKLAHLYSVFGKDTKDIPRAVAGDIIAISKVDEITRGSTITTGDLRVTVAGPSYPKPMVGVAVSPKSRADDAKIGPALHKLVEADPTLESEVNPQTHERVVTGRSNLHLDTVFARLKSRYKIEVETRLPKVPYLETVTATAEADYRHKKQTGGAGQFAHVYLRIEPRERGEGFEFMSKIVGGAISSSFLPSIEKGIRQVMDEGIIAGFQFVDCSVVVYDGKEHPVDSKDIAFQIAGRNAFKAAVEKARPVLLEPIADVEIHAPNDAMGSIMGDINTRRGRITASEAVGDLATIKAQIPEAEMQTYSNELRSMTGGEGAYSMERSHYEPVPQHMTAQVVAKYKSVDD